VSQKQVSDFNSTVTDLNAQIANLKEELDKVRASNIKTVVETKTVTKTVPKWVPNGKGIKVDLTGFEGEIEIHDA
jgi:uncharacterized protein YlxW (UPF0749 family)